MEKFTTHKGLVLPVDRANIDTDAIIPKQYLKSISRSGFGINLFDGWRYLNPGGLHSDHTMRELNHNFVLNHERYQGVSIILTRDNFGCGSSREHAVWALTDFGVRAIIAPSFADIFFSNSFKNGLLPIVLDRNIVDKLFVDCQNTTGFSLTIDLEQQLLVSNLDNSYNFEIDPFHKRRLLNGLDDIALSLQHSDAIHKFEEKRQQEKPWIFNL